MLYNESPRWMAPLNLLAGFVGLLLALLTEFGAGVEFVGGAVVFMPLALLVVALSSLCCVFSTLPILRKSTTVLGALIRMGFAIGVPGAVALLTLISWNVSDIATLSFVYTLLFIGALTAFWWYHLFPLVDFVAAVMVGVMICTNYDLAVGLGAGALWLHRIVGLLAMVALIWGACRVIGSGGALYGLAGLAVPFVTGIIWMVFESCNELSSQTWMIIPIAIVMAVSFYVFARIYDFWDAIKGGGSSSSGSSSGGSSSSGYRPKTDGGDRRKIADPHGKKASSYVRSGDFKADDCNWDVRVEINGTTIYVKGVYEVDVERYKAATGFYTASYLDSSARRIVVSCLEEYYDGYDGPSFSLSLDLKYKLIH